jgi:RNA polymerase sigma-70 factor, ECF subfamily
VQDALTKAWAARKRFKAGTSMRAWTFVILKNTYLSSLRRKKFTGDYDEAKAEIALVTPPEQEDQLHLADLRRAMAELPVDQREALILVGAEGFSYEEAAEIADCAIGTMKSRVSRARARLEDIFASGNLRVGHAEAEEATGALDKLLDTPDEVEP